MPSAFRPTALALALAAALPTAQAQLAPGLPLKPQGNLSLTPPLKDDRRPAYFYADQIEGVGDQQVIAQGNVEMRQFQKVLNADWMKYLEQSEEIFAQGRVRFYDRENQMEGPYLYLKQDVDRGYIEQPTFLLGRSAGHGKAEKLLFEGTDKYRLRRTSYSTCPVGQEDWSMNVDDLELDYATKIGVAREATIRFMDTPIFYLPWMDFALEDERKTGFLAPTFGNSGKNGFSVATPYYWNIAPNRDLTVTPRLMTKRGFTVDGEYRYLHPRYVGEVRAELVPRDNIAERTRSALSVKHTETFNNVWNLQLNIQRVSDDDFFRDYADRISSTSQTNLPREGVLTWNYPYGFVQTRIQRFQTLQDPAAPVLQPYGRTPQITWIDSRQNVQGFDFNWNSELAEFNHPTLVNGRRLHLYPSVSYPLISPYSFIVPKLGVHYTKYDLGRNNLPSVPGVSCYTLSCDNSAMLPSSQRSAPILSLDSGLVFERESDFFGRAYTQTLEPRIYYLRIPYRDQRQIPIFDASIADFNFAQMFTENRFNGLDRLNDANQLTMAVTTRLLDPNSGGERLKAAIGQRFYFNEQQVTLTAPATQRRSSSFLAALSGQVSPHWNVDSAWQFNPSSRQTEKATFGARFQPGPTKVLNLAYRYMSSNLDPNTTALIVGQTVKQIDVSGQWPLTKEWYAVGRWNYSIADKRVLEGLAGLEYNAGCWVFRVVAQRFTTSTQQSSNSIFLQLELNGLSKIGSNPLDLLRRSVSGYTILNAPPPATEERPSPIYR